MIHQEELLEQGTYQRNILLRYVPLDQMHWKSCDFCFFRGSQALRFFSSHQIKVCFVFINSKYCPYCLACDFSDIFFLIITIFSWNSQRQNTFMFLFLCVHVNYNFSQGEVCGNIEIRENHNVVPLLYIPITSLQNALYVVNCFVMFKLYRNIFCHCWTAGLSFQQLFHSNPCIFNFPT